MKRLNHTSGILQAVAGAVLAAGLISAQGKVRENKDMDSSEKREESQKGGPALTEAGRYEKATFAAGCFWGVEAAFRQVKGVISTTVGYTGGRTKNPTYRRVCSGRTGHAEAVELIYDPNQTSYEQLLAVFWRIHDPTTLDRQGPDIGKQYRSAIFYHNERQLSSAKSSKKRLEESGRFKRPIVTEITAASRFYKAEEYHQRYLEKQGRISCRLPVK